MLKGSNRAGDALRGKRVLWRLLLLVGQICVTESAIAELSGIATLTSQYIYRGQAVSDGDPAVQFGLDYEFDSGFFVGVWASTIDLETQFGLRDTELDFYAGYHFTPEAPVSLTAALVRYTYPGQTGAHDYDYNEAIVSATLYERYTVEFGYTDDHNSLDRIARHWEVRADWPNAGAWVISAGLGSNDVTAPGLSSYLHWDLGASTRFSRLTVDLRFYANETHEAPLAALSADSKFVVSLSMAF